jgi:hypothetical protein
VYIITPYSCWAKTKSPSQLLKERIEEEELLARLMMESRREEVPQTQTTTVNTVPGGIPTIPTTTPVVAGPDIYWSPSDAQVYWYDNLSESNEEVGGLPQMLASPNYPDNIASVYPFGAEVIRDITALRNIQKFTVDVDAALTAIEETSDQTYTLSYGLKLNNLQNVISASFNNLTSAGYVTIYGMTSLAVLKLDNLQETITGGVISFNISLNNSLLILSCPNLVSVAGGFNIETLASLTTISFPLLTTVGSDSINHFLSVTGAEFLTTLDFQSLQTVDGYALYIYPGGPGRLESINLTNLQSVAGELYIRNTAVALLIMDNLVTVSGDMTIIANVNLATMSMSNFIPTSGNDIDFSECALNVTSVNHILARCVANPAYVSGTVNLSSGTNAAPSGQGATDVLTLIARGVTVITN